MTEEQPDAIEEPTPSELDNADSSIDDALADIPREDTARSRALNDAEAGTIAAARRSTVVVLAGEVGSGKTTLLAALYERFGRGEVARHAFAGSLTLPGFEARCWGLRRGSGRVTPAMPHTQRNALPWLHLRVTPPAAEAQDLLLGDFDGEIFGDIIDGKIPASDVPALRRADHLAVVLDGETLANPVRRQATLQRSQDLLGALGRQPNAIASPEVITIVVTKQDAIDRADIENQRAVLRAIETVRDATSNAFPKYVPAVISTAAVSRIGELPLGHGLDELLALWSEQPAVHVEPRAVSSVPMPKGDWLARFTA